MTTTEESSLLEPPRDPDSKAVITKERLDSLKKAREAKAKKVKELNEKEVDLLNTIKNVYHTMSILDTRVNALDLHVRGLGKRAREEEEEIPTPQKKPKVIEDGENTKSNDEPPLSHTILRGAGLALAFTATRMAAYYLDKWQTTQFHKDTSHDVHIPAFM